MSGSNARREREHDAVRDLDDIEAKWGDQWHMAPNDLRALVAEVRRLREDVGRWREIALDRADP